MTKSMDIRTVSTDHALRRSVHDLGRAGTALSKRWVMADHSYLNFEAASRQLGISSRTLHRWADRGIVPVIDDGSGRRLVDLEAARVVAARPQASLSAFPASVSESLDSRLAALEERVTVLEALAGIEAAPGDPASCP